MFLRQSSLNLSKIHLQKEPLEVFSKKKGFLKNFAYFTGKRLCWSLFSIKSKPSGLQHYYTETPTQMFSSEICKNFKNTDFQEHAFAQLLLHIGLS